MGKCGTANHRLSTKSRYSGEHPANTNSTQQTSWGGQDTTLGAFFGIYLRKKPTERKKQGGLTNKQKWNHTKVQIHPNSSSSDLGELKKGWQRPWTTTSVRMHRFGHFTTIGPVRERPMNIAALKCDGYFRPDNLTRSSQPAIRSKFDLWRLPRLRLGQTIRGRTNIR